LKNIFLTKTLGGITNGKDNGFFSNELREYNQVAGKEKGKKPLLDSWQTY